MNTELLLTKLESQRSNIEKMCYDNSESPSLFKEANPSAVLVGFMKSDSADKVELILTKRQDKLDNHSKEISLPGGRTEAGETPFETAIRETEEELGISRELIKPYYCLPNCYTATGFCITPVVAFINAGAKMIANEAEVASIHKIDFDLFFDANLISYLPYAKKYNHNGYDKSVCYDFDTKVVPNTVWGATAAIIQYMTKILS